ncbi:hypothetical protein T492DRAFT_430396 [Pavlovales sp. CCMP2436]|nr:hypothetical protein T492DRAFT_430396 [Pavlovales sp. CCMP2436]
MNVSLFWAMLSARSACGAMSAAYRCTSTSRNFANLSDCLSRSLDAAACSKSASTTGAESVSLRLIACCRMATCCSPQRPLATSGAMIACFQ